jgi:hypothetical protein
MGVELAVQEGTTKADGDARFVARPAMYIAIVLVVVLAAYAYTLRTDGIFACSAEGYTPDRYLGYCNARGYGDYEHGAFWFGLERSTQDFAGSATVLFLGNSRLQIALSTAVTADWFSSAGARYFLMGFGYDGNVVFEGALLRKFKPHAKVYVINIDQFFGRFESPPARTVMRDSSAGNQYELKRIWQFVHERSCKAFPLMCGSRYTIFRSRETGAYHVQGLGEFKKRGVSQDLTIDQAAAQDEAESAREFLSSLPVERDCVILTVIPYAGTKIGTSNAIAHALGMNLVMPKLDGLQTFDGSHLDQASAERWSEGFLEAAGPSIRKCLNRP